MTFDYIDKAYGVRAKRGDRVIAIGCPGVITGTDGQYLRIRLDGLKHSHNYHPTYKIELAGKTAEVANAP